MLAILGTSGLQSMYLDSMVNRCTVNELRRYLDTEGALEYEPLLRDVRSTKISSELWIDLLAADDNRDEGLQLGFSGRACNRGALALWLRLLAAVKC